MGSSQISVSQAITLISPREEEIGVFRLLWCSLPSPSPQSLCVCGYVWACMAVCVRVRTNVCVDVHLYMWICTYLYLCEDGSVRWTHPLFLAQLYWLSCTEDPDRCFLSLFHCCFSSVGQQLQCQAFSDVHPLVQYGKGDMPGGGGVKWVSVPTALFQEQTTNTLECQLLSVGSQSGAGQELGFRAAPIVKYRFSVNLIIGAVAPVQAESAWILNSKNNCCWRISITPYMKAKHPYTANVMHELQKTHTVCNTCLYWSWIYILNLHTLPSFI